MDLDVGMVVSGKVSGIKKFGAFVRLDCGKNGLVHISEITNTYVSDVSDYLQDGQEVKVKVIGIDSSGRINLSIRQTVEAAEQPQPQPQPRNSRSLSAGATGNAGKADESFEEKLKQFMQESNSKISGSYLFAQNTSRRRTRN